MCGHGGAYSVLAGKHEANRLPGRPRCRLVNDIKVDF